MSIVRFDPLFRTVRDFDRMTGELLGSRAAYAPEYDIVEQGEDKFAVALAVPGYDLDELEITVKDRELQIKGEPRTSEATPEDRPNYVRRGIVRGAFQRSFTLGDHIEITGASLDKGILRIELERRVPEAMKPRTIQIAAPAASAAVAAA